MADAIGSYENRRANLRLLIDQWGGPKPLSKKLGYRNASFLVQMAGPHPTREVTEKTARAIEVKLELPAGWMDREPGLENGKTHVDTALVCSAIRAVAQEAEDLGVKLTPSKLADVVNLVYGDAEKTGRISLELVKQVLKLMV